MREKMAAAAGWALLGLALWLCAAAGAGEPEGKRRAGPAKKKDIRDYNDADMARLLEQWEVRGGGRGPRGRERSGAERSGEGGRPGPRSRLGAAVPPGPAAPPPGEGGRFGARGPAVLPPGAVGVAGGGFLRVRVGGRL